MTEDDDRMLEDGAPYMGPTLRECYSMVRKMDRVLLCAVCPAAQWYLTIDIRGGEELEAFCTRFRGVMYDGRKVVSACDARDDAIANMDA